MDCSKNGIKREGESCTLNNNCIYPDCMEAEKWAEEYLNSEEGEKEIALLNQETLEYMLYGKPTRYLNEELLDEIKNYGMD
jgi:hypothetical protein